MYTNLIIFMPINYSLLKDVIGLIELFEKEAANKYSMDTKGFEAWISDRNKQRPAYNEPEWEGKEKGRSPESVINTLIVHLNRYAKSYSKSAISDSGFSTQEEFIYLINLKAFGSMSKMELIKKNIQDKPGGMKIINRLISQQWIKQSDSEKDRRSKILKITDKGLRALEKQMSKIRQATSIVTGDLTHDEKMELIRLLKKLDEFHKPIYHKNIESSALLDEVTEKYLPNKKD